MLPVFKAPIVLRSVTAAAACSRAKHTLPDLQYDYNALEPVISSEIMQLHHQKHHATYVNNLNMIEEKMHEAVEKGNILEAIKLEPALRFNGGGHINHSIFWTNLAKDGGEPSSELLTAIEKDFGSMEQMQERLSTASIGVQGSGWGWLGYCNKAKMLKVYTCPNQDPLESTTGMIPIFGIDVWEHAYYLQYKNVRPDYVKAIWKIANWKNMNERYANATSK